MNAPSVYESTVLVVGEPRGTSMADPLIAVVGSVDPGRGKAIKLKNTDRGQQAAETLGRALARQRCRIVAYMDDPWSVEVLVVKGYVAEYSATAALKGSGPRIEVHYSASDKAPHFPEQDTNDDLFHPVPDKNLSWASSFYRSLSRVDGVILMGGGETTYVAGTVALMQKRPVIAVAAFGGAAEQIWRELSPEAGILEDGDIRQMATPNWTSQVADNLVKNALEQMKRLRDRDERSQVATKGQHAISHVYVAVLLLIASLVPVPFTWDNPDLPKWGVLMLLLLSPLLAGVSGATAGTAYEAIRAKVSQDPPSLGVTAGLGAIAGGVAGILFAIAQLVAMSPEIGNEIFSKQAGRLVALATLIGFIGGFTLDAVFRKLSGTNVISDEVLKTLMSGRADSSSPR
jgi:hypothetical protein